MEELAADGLFVGVIDFTTDELADELVGGFHAAGRSGCGGSAGSGCRRSSCPAASTSPCTDAPRKCRRALQGRPVYTHNPEFTLVRTCRDGDGAARARSSRERLNEATGPIECASCRPRAVHPERAGRRVLGSRTPTPASSRPLRGDLRADIPISTHRARTSTRPSSPCAVAERFRRASLVGKEPSNDRPCARQAAVDTTWPTWPTPTSRPI